MTPRPPRMITGRCRSSGCSSSSATTAVAVLVAVRVETELPEPVVVADQRGRRVADRVDHLLQRRPVGWCLQVLDDVGLDAPLGEDLERAAGLGAPGVVVHEHVAHAPQGTVCLDHEQRGHADDHRPRRVSALGRDDVNDVESILADDAIDFGAVAHATPGRRRRRVHLGLRAEPAGPRRSSTSGPRPRSGTARPTSTGRSRSTSSRPSPWTMQARDGAAAGPASPSSPARRSRSGATKEWTNLGVEAFRWRMSQFLHGEQGALICTAKIVETVPWIDAKYYAATQVDGRGPPRRGVLPLPRHQARRPASRSTPTCSCSSTTSSRDTAGT